MHVVVCNYWVRVLKSTPGCLQKQQHSPELAPNFQAGLAHSGSELVKCTLSFE